MAKKEMEKVKFKSGKEIMIDRDFFLNDIIEAMTQSKGIFSSVGHLVVAVSTITMLFDKLQLTDFLHDREVSIEDYEQWFEKSAKENDVDQLIYKKLFGDKNGK